MIGRLSWPLTFEFKKEPFLWLAAGIATLLLFLFVTFPFGALQTRLLSEIGRASGWDVRAADWSVGLPLAVEWRDLVFAKAGAGTIPVESMRVGIGLLAHLAGRATIDASVRFPGSVPPGAARATASLTASSWSLVGPAQLKARLQQLDLSQFVKPYVSKGLLQAEVVQAWVGNPGGGITFKGDGAWKAEIRDLVLERIPLGPAQIPSLVFTRVTLGLACHDASCDVTEFRGEGPDGTITGQGRLLLQQPIRDSMLELTLTVLPGSGWAQKSAGLPIPPLPPGTPMTFKVTGSVANPRVSV
ncbi:MAG TPA: type II secretion system protein GspN [Nitrospira sp.]|nr:type II secretion system protein GspN [Nitrospira sp.]